MNNVVSSNNVATNMKVYTLTENYDRDSFSPPLVVVSEVNEMGVLVSVRCMGHQHVAKTEISVS